MFDVVSIDNLSQVANAEDVPRWRNRARVLPMGRAAEWKRAMAQRVRLADGTELDMLDARSIREYVNRTLALTVEPSAPQLKRLEMLAAHADELEAKAKAETPPVAESTDELAAARERLRLSLGNR